jgi:hypothetical protein
MANALGRWASPDEVNLTEARAVNPANTLNKYIYGGNNPLKYRDPDGEDITLFYTDTGAAGHFWMIAYDPSGKNSAVMDFGPSKSSIGANFLSKAIGQDVPGTTDYDAHKDIAAIKENYASLTIQTNPADTQKAIDAINQFNGKYHDWNVVAPNCTTVCRDVLALVLGFDNNATRPASLWDAVFRKWSHRALSKRPVTVAAKHGVDYGRPRGNPFGYLELLLGIKHDAPTTAPKKERVSSQVCFTDENGKITYCQ